MRAAAHSLNIKLLVLLLGLVLFVLCKPADGAGRTRGAGGSATVATAKAKHAATVKKAHPRKKSRKATTRRTRRSTTRKAKAAKSHKTSKANRSNTTAAGKNVEVKGADIAVGAAKSAHAKPAHGKAPAGRAALAAKPAPVILSSPARQDNATSPAPGARWTEPRTGMVFRWIPGGCFVMGSPKSEPGRERDEGPQHKVCLSGFWLGETEVTQGQWSAVTGSNPSLIKNGDDQPVDMVSWNMARNFAKTLGQGGAERYRLPTEAEWEYACRAGTTTPYFFGDAVTSAQATFDKPFVLPLRPLAPTRGGHRGRHSRQSTRKAPEPKIWPNMHTTVVGSHPANAFGLFDMHGNLWEWCEDVYDPGFYARSPRENPLRLGEGKSRVMRGGSWVTRAESLRSANRGHGWPDMRTAFYGLRLVRLASPTEPEAPGQPAAGAVPGQQPASADAAPLDAAPVDGAATPPTPTPAR